jgi:hypothetical protein
MRFFWLIIDRVLRIAAVGVAVIAVPILLILGAMAGDSGRAIGYVVGFVTVLVGGGLILLVLRAAWDFRKADGSPGRGSIWRWRFNAALVYLVGSAGLLIAGRFSVPLMSLIPRRSLEVAAYERGYPHLNSHPIWVIHVAGTLPETVPLASFKADYITDPSEPDKKDPTCKRDSPTGGGGYPLRHTELVEPVRAGGRYTLSIIVDKFEPGFCKWRLQAVMVRMRGKDDSYQPGGIVPVAVEPSNRNLTGRTSPQIRADVWCRKARPGDPTTEVCGAFPLDRPDLARLVAPEARNQSLLLLVSPGEPTLEINFHELNMPTAAAPMIWNSRHPRAQACPEPASFLRDRVRPTVLQCGVMLLTDIFEPYSVRQAPLNSAVQLLNKEFRLARLHKYPPRYSVFVDHFM